MDQIRATIAMMFAYDPQEALLCLGTAAMCCIGLALMTPLMVWALIDGEEDELVLTESKQPVDMLGEEDEAEEDQ